MINTRQAGRGAKRTCGYRRTRTALDDIVKMLNDPSIVFTTTPQNVMKYVDFMYKIGSIKVKPGLVEGPVLPERHSAARQLDASSRACADDLT